MRIAGSLPALSFVVFASLSAAQITPGDVIASDQGGTLWHYDKNANLTTFTTLPSAPFGIDIDYNGDAICGGSGIVWRVDRNTGQATTILSGTPVTGLVADVEVWRGGTFFVTALSTSNVYQVDQNGNVTTQYPLAGRGWGMGIDQQKRYLYVATSTAVNLVDLSLGTVATIYTGTPLNFCQGGCFGPQGKFVFGDETGKEMFEIDENGVLSTILSGAPFSDVGEGVDHLANGDFLLTDDGSGTSPKLNNIWQVSVSGPTLSTFVSGGPVTDYNCVAVSPELVLTGQRSAVKIGTAQNFLVTSTGAASEPYIFAASLSANRGTLLPGGRLFPLDFDNLMSAVLGNVFPAIFVNFQGVLSQAGAATLTVNVPNDAQLIGVDFYTAGVSIHPSAPAGIHLVSSAFTTRITS